jgi:hypothetical protein
LDEEGLSLHTRDHVNRRFRDRECESAATATPRMGSRSPGQATRPAARESKHYELSLAVYAGRATFPSAAPPHTKTKVDAKDLEKGIPQTERSLDDLTRKVR